MPSKKTARMGDKAKPLAAYRQRSRWRYVEKQIIDAARGGDVTAFARLHGEMLEGVECNE